MVLQGMHFWQEYHRSDDVPFSVHRIRRHVILTCLIPGDGYTSDHLVKVVFARLLNYEVTVFPFVIRMYFVESYFMTM